MRVQKNLRQCPTIPKCPLIVLDTVQLVKLSATGAKAITDIYSLKISFTDINN